MPTLPLTHHPQQYLTDCLPACVKIVLDYYRVKIRYERVRRLLRSLPDGTPFDNLTLLTSLGLGVLVANEFRQPMAMLNSYIIRSVPIILSVSTAYLPYWTEDTDHAVVVAGIDADSVALYDPWFPDAPKLVERIHLESAWLESAFKYGVITQL